MRGRKANNEGSWGIPQILERQCEPKIELPAKSFDFIFSEAPLKECLMDKYELLLTLNDLLRTSKDGENRFRTCAQNAKNSKVKRMLEAAADRCAEGAEQLRAKICGLGGEPHMSGSVNGPIGIDDHDILAECERDQYLAKDRYEAALDVDLPREVRAMVERHYRVVAENHHRIRILRNEA